VPFEHVTDAQRPFPSTAVMCVVEPSRSPEPECPASGEALLVETVKERLRARNLRLLHRGDDGREIGRARRIEQCQGERDQHATRRRRRICQHIPPGVAGAHRVTDLRLVGGEVVGAEGSATLDNPLRHPARDLAGVERLRPLSAVALQRVGQLTEDEALTLEEDAPRGRVDRRALRLIGEDRIEDLEDERLLGVHLDALAGEPSWVAYELGQWHRAEAVESPRQPGRRPGHAARRGPDIEDLRLLRTEVDGDRQELGATLPYGPAWNLDEEVQQDVLACWVVYEHEAACPQPGERALGDE